MRGRINGTPVEPSRPLVDAEQLDGLGRHAAFDTLPRPFAPFQNPAKAAVRGDQHAAGL